MGALDQYEELHDPTSSVANSGALSSAANPSSSPDQNDLQGRKDIFNEATQRLLQARQQMQAPYQGEDLGALALSADMGKASGMPVAEGYTQGMLDKAKAEQVQRDAQQVYQQQLSGMDTQAQLAKIMSNGGSIQDTTALAGITGNDKLADTLIKQQTVDQGKYLPIKDSFGNVTGVLNTKTGTMINPNSIAGIMSNGKSVPTAPSADPQIAAQQILEDVGTPLAPMMTRQDINGRNAQTTAYQNAAIAAKSMKQKLDELKAQDDKYWSGGAMGTVNAAENYFGIDPFGGAAARAEADKASKGLANAFMQANVGAKGSGIRMVEFDAGAVPNANMPKQARDDLIAANKAIADSQIQRAAISNMYPRMHIANVNAIMDKYEEMNPPVLGAGEDAKPNPKWMTYKDWLAAGRPNTAQIALTTKDDNASTNKTSKTDNAPQVLSAPPAGNQRVKGQTYPTPKGNMVWMGDHWTPAGGQ